MDTIIATVSENYLVMVMPVFDVPYQHGASDVKATVSLSWGGGIVHRGFSSSCPFCLWMRDVQLDLGCNLFFFFLFFLAYTSQYVCVQTCVCVCVCVWLVTFKAHHRVCDVYDFLREREHRLLLKVWLRHSHSLHHQSAFVVFICLPLDTDSIPPLFCLLCSTAKMLCWGGDAEEQLGIQNSGYFKSWKFTMGINGITWALMGINWKFVKLQASL